MDVLTQVEAIEGALSGLGHATARIPFTRELDGFISGIRAERVDLVLNLCETVDEDPTLAWHPAAVLELLGIAFSGSPSSALMLTADKVLTKRLLKASHIGTPDYRVYEGLKGFEPGGLKFPVIVKPRFQDASIGIDQESIFEDERSLLRGLEPFRARFGTLLVEEYIRGREFNISVFGYPTPTVLPLAEIDFSAFPQKLYHIVGYRAKWEKGSFEYHNTPRSFPDDLPWGLRSSLERTALDCFSLFMVRDYGRVDIRVDDQGRVYVLEVNANPCLSPDAGLAAAFRRTGLDYPQLVASLTEFAQQRLHDDAHKACGLAG